VRCAFAAVAAAASQRDYVAALARTAHLCVGAAQQRRVAHQQRGGALAGDVQAHPGPRRRVGGVSNAATARLVQVNGGAKNFVRHVRGRGTARRRLALQVRQDVRRQSAGGAHALRLRCSNAATRLQPWAAGARAARPPRAQLLRRQRRQRRQRRRSARATAWRALCTRLQRVRARAACARWRRRRRGAHHLARFSAAD
jgi:hypothetical protein